MHSTSLRPLSQECIRTDGLSTMAYVYAVCVIIFSTGGKIRPALNFMELHALTQATLLACTYSS